MNPGLSNKVYLILCKWLNKLLIILIHIYTHENNVQKEKCIFLVFLKGVILLTVCLKPMSWNSETRRIT